MVSNRTQIRESMKTSIEKGSGEWDTANLADRLEKNKRLRCD
jgi:hypothetical protein